MSEARTERGSGMAGQQAQAARASAPASICLHIEHVVLEGSFTSGQLGQLQASMEQELTSLLRAGGLPLHNKAESVLRAPVRGSGSTARSPVQLGQSLARSVYGALSPSAPSALPPGRGPR